MNNQEAAAWLSQLSAGIEWELDMHYAEAIDMAIEALKAQPQNTFENTCDPARMPHDCISRKAATKTALEFIVEYLGGAFDEDFQKELIERMNTLPSAQPDRKMGRWRARRWIGATEDWRQQIVWWKCSECGMDASTQYKYCPDCGAEMRGERDD